MPVTSDSNQYGVAIDVKFNRQALDGCVNPALLDALESEAVFRADIPDTSTSSGVQVSDQQYNLIRLDGNGALYAPASQVVTLVSQTVPFAKTVGPGVPVEVRFSIPTISDFSLAFPDVSFNIQPYGSLIRLGQRRIEPGNLIYSFYRDIDADMNNQEDAVIQASGKILLIPSPSA